MNFLVLLVLIISATCHLPSIAQAEPDQEKALEQKTAEIRPLSPAEVPPSPIALQQLAREFEREQQLKQMLSREIDIPINSKDPRFAPYAADLRRQIEKKLATAPFPVHANIEKLSDIDRQVLIKLTVEQNGEPGGIEVLRPSSIAKFNDIVINAIKGAAPFRPLPTSWGADRARFYMTLYLE